MGLKGFLSCTWIANFLGFVTIIIGARGSKNLSCDVAIVGGGISGLYMADTLLSLHLEGNVCLFEKENKLGGRILDHTFESLPDVPISLGAWRIDKGNAIVRQIMRRFEIDSTPLRIPKRADRLEARGVFATNQSSLQKQAFPLLSNVKLGPYKTVSYKNMAKYLLSKRETAPQYSSLSTFLQDHLTPEGLNFLTDLIAFPPYFAQEPNAETFFESLEKYKHFTRNFILPHKGVSALTDALKASVIRQKGKIYKDEEVKTIDELGKNIYSLKTARFKVIAKKLVLAVPMKSMQKIHGSLAGKIKNNPIFKSIGYQVAYKMIALYEKAWWKHNSSTSWRLNDEQNCRSNSDCLGYTFPYRERGPNGEAILQAVYAKSHCAVKWGELLKISRKVTDQEIHKALKRLFPGIDIPKPLQSVHQYWEDGFQHMQRAGTHISVSEVIDWAKRPFPQQEVFIVGEAYNLIRGWVEGALQSAKNALEEGWNMKISDMQPQRVDQTRVLENFYDLDLY